jgi:hypothetical protein
MNRQNIIPAIVVLLLVGATAGVLARAKTNQKLGEPGIKSRPVPGSKNLELLLPETVPGYTSEIMTNAEDIMKILPADSSYRVRYYKAPDGFAAQLNVVLMGSDRTSIHKPQICLTGQGWVIDNNLTRVEPIHLDRPVAFDLTVRKLISTKQFTGPDGQPQTARGIYVYWFVDGDRITASPLQWMLWWMPRDLLLHGLLERWAYVSYFSACSPGQEEATYARMKQLIAETVPEFQLVPRPGK